MENQGFHPTHPNFQTLCKKNENQNPGSSNVELKSCNTPHELGWVGCDADSSSLPGVGDCGGIGVGTAKTGVGESATITPNALALTTAGRGVARPASTAHVDAYELLQENDSTDGEQEYLLATDEQPSPAESPAEVVQPPADESLNVGERVFIVSMPHTDRLGPYPIESIDADCEVAKIEGFAKLIALADLRKAD
jgi:hypothetical protein